MVSDHLINHGLCIEYLCSNLVTNYIETIISGSIT